MEGIRTLNCIKFDFPLFVETFFCPIFMKTENERKLVIHFSHITFLIDFTTFILFPVFISSTLFWLFMIKPELRNHETLSASASLSLHEILASIISSLSVFYSVLFRVLVFPFATLVLVPGWRPCSSAVSPPGFCLSKGRFAKVLLEFCSCWRLRATLLGFLFHFPSCFQTQNGFNARKRCAFDRFSFTFHWKIVDFVVNVV